MEDEIKIALDKKFDALQKELKKAQELGASKEEVLKLHAAIKTQGENLADFVADQKEKQIETVVKQFEVFLIKNVSRLEEIKNNKHGIVEFIPKAVGDMSTASGGDVETPPSNMNTNLNGINLRNDNALMQLATVTSTSKDSYTYTEMEPKEGGYASVAEGGVKPKTDFLWKTRYATPKKTAAYIVLSDEAATDIKRLVSVARTYLRQKHDLFKVNDAFFGDGLNENLLGATQIARRFDAGDMALKVDEPNFMDTVNAGLVDIYTAVDYEDEGNFEANIVMVNPVDFYLNLVSAKDGNGLPLYPQAGLFNTVNIGGVTIKPWVKIPTGKIFIADMKRFNIANYVPFAISVGWINNQFITNQFTMLGESRYFGYVKQLDKKGFIYDDIDVIKTAITKP